MELEHQKWGTAAASGRPEGEAARDHAFPGGTTILPGERLQVKREPINKEGSPSFRFRRSYMVKTIPGSFSKPVTTPPSTPDL